MANNYTLSSSFLPLTREQLGLVSGIVEKVRLELAAEDCDEYGIESPTPEDLDDFSLGLSVVEQDEGVWFSHDESCNIDQKIIIIQALLEGLKIDEPFVFSWASVCDKPRIDQFDGGAVVLRRGHEPYVINAVDKAYAFVSQLLTEADRPFTDTERLDYLLQYIRIDDVGDMRDAFKGVVIRREEMEDAIRATPPDKNGFTTCVIHDWDDDLRDVIDRAMRAREDVRW